MVKIAFRRFLLPVLFVLAILPCRAHAVETGTMSISPAAILMGAQFDGITLKVQGTVPAGSDVLLRFSGAPEELHLRKKGKVFGFLWMNIGKIHLKNVPRVCLIDSSRSFADLGTAAIPFRLASFNNTIEIEEEAQSKDFDIIAELLTLKKEQGLYEEKTQGVALGPDTGTGRTFTADLSVPSVIAPGHYSVEAVAIRDGAVVARSTSVVEAEMVGFPKFLSVMAFNKGLLYGVLSTIIAIAGGLAIGIVFQSKGAH